MIVLDNFHGEKTTDILYFRRVPSRRFLFFKSIHLVSCIHFRFLEIRRFQKDLKTPSTLVNTSEKTIVSYCSCPR